MSLDSAQFWLDEVTLRYVRWNEMMQFKSGKEGIAYTYTHTECICVYGLVVLNV